MNEQLNYYLAQAHTADLIRKAQSLRFAGARGHRQRRPRTAIRRILDSVPRAGTRSVEVHPGPTHRLPDEERSQQCPRTCTAG